MGIVGVIFFVVFLIEITIRPRIGFTREKRVILWYGKNDRKYIFIV